MDELAVAAAMGSTLAVLLAVAFIRIAGSGPSL
jgi:hypothetical protein